MSSYFEKSFVFYLSYHNNSTNQWIHIFCVWPILFTAQIFFAYWKFYLGQYLISASTILSAIYVLFYLIIEQPGWAGYVAAGLTTLGYYGTNALVEFQPDIWKGAAILHVLLWVAQIYGHQVYEGRSPAFLDNLFQAFMMAPIFVLMEVMFSFGYKSDFKKMMHKQAIENIVKFRTEQNKSK